VVARYKKIEYDMKSLYESIFDIDDNIDAVDPEKLYGFWNAKTGDEYEEMGERFTTLIKNSSKKTNYNTLSDIKSNKYYIEFTAMLDGLPTFAFYVYFKKGSKYLKLFVRWPYWDDKVNISISPLAEVSYMRPRKCFEVDKRSEWIIKKLIEYAK
jgi:hypothetical protein